MNADEAGAMPNLSRRDARRRARVVVAVYALCLVILVLAGSYLAPAEALDAPVAPNGGLVEVSPSSLQAH